VTGISVPSMAYERAFLYSNGQMTNLGTLPEYYSSYGYAINNEGEVTGASGTSPVGPDHAILYSNGQMRDLGGLPGYSNNTGLAINDAGQVVGTAFNVNSSISRAFLYSNGQMQDLNNMIDPSLGLTLSDARAINDSGQIVANGGNRAFLLTPVPEQSTLLLSGVAVIALFVHSRRPLR